MTDNEIISALLVMENQAVADMKVKDKETLDSTIVRFEEMSKQLIAYKIAMRSLEMKLAFYRNSRKEVNQDE